MDENEYEGIFEEQEVKLIRRWAKRAGIQPAELPDVTQEAAMAVTRRPEEWLQASRGQRKQQLWVITRNIVARIQRSDRRRRKRDEQKASMADEAYCDVATPLRLDVRKVVASLNEKHRTVCELLSQGLSKAQIAEKMGCSWHTVDRMVGTIRQRLEEAGVNEWLQ